MIDEFELPLLEFIDRRRRLIAELPQSADGLTWSRAYSNLADSVVQWVYSQVAERIDACPALSIVATGGYGRQELSPHSDLDLAVIPLDEQAPSLDSFVREIYRLLHLALDRVFKTEVGYSYRLVGDAPSLDGKSRSGLLDARLVAGSAAPVTAFNQVFQETFPVGDFLLDKLTERRERMARTHDTPLVVEPHLKEGAGGLRSYHTAHWIRMVLKASPPDGLDSYSHVLRTRNLLHFVSEKQVDLLSRSRQAQIADLLGLDLASWLSTVAEHLLVLQTSFEDAGWLIRTSSYPISRGVAAESGRVKFGVEATLSDAAIGVSLGSGLGLRIERGEVITEGEVDGGEVLHALATGESTLRNMDRNGLLSQILPELARCKTLMPEDATHTYTVFEHTLRAIRNCESFVGTPFLGDVLSGISSPDILILALLLHDAGKGLDERPHSESGAELADQVCRRWGLSDSVREPVRWLVAEHLTMARFIRMRDIQNPATAAEFAEIVSTRERLDMLTVLTAADIMAVSSAAWTSSQETLLRELWERTVAILEADIPPEHDPAIYRRRIHRALAKDQEVSEEALQAFLDSLPAHYVLSTHPSVVKLHFGFCLQARNNNKPTIEVSHQAAAGNTEITVCCPDSPGLLSRLLGVLYAWDLSVESIRVSTSIGTPNIALDSFVVSFHGQPLPGATCQHATSDLLKVIEGRVSVEELLRRHGKDPDRRQTHFRSAYVAGTPGILEVQAPRGRGMAFRLARFIAEQNWDVCSARIGQWAGNGTAAFYITGPHGEALDPANVTQAIRSGST